MNQSTATAATADPEVRATLPAHASPHMPVRAPCSSSHPRRLARAKRPFAMLMPGILRHADWVVVATLFHRSSVQILNCSWLSCFTISSPIIPPNATSQSLTKTKCKCLPTAWLAASCVRRTVFQGQIIMATEGTWDRMPRAPLDRPKLTRSSRPHPPRRASTRLSVMRRRGNALWCIVYGARRVPTPGGGVARKGA